MVIGQVHWPPVRYRILAICCMIWSIDGVMKSANWISATGRKPTMAAPTDPPAIYTSDMGEFFDALADDEDGTVLLDVYTQGTLRFVALDSTGIADSIAQAPMSLLDKIVSVLTNKDNIVLVTEHENEEDDYEKPVCKRLEESGERYDEED